MGFIAVEKLERFSTNDLYYGTTLFHTNLSNCYKTVETTLKNAHFDISDIRIGNLSNFKSFIFRFWRQFSLTTTFLRTDQVT